MNTPKQFTIENLQNDDACNEGLAYAQTLIKRNVDPFTTCMQEELAYAEWIMCNGYVESCETTRNAVLINPEYSYLYALDVDKSEIGAV